MKRSQFGVSTMVLAVIATAGVTNRVASQSSVTAVASATAAAPTRTPIRTPTRTPSHAAFDALLKAHVRGGLVDYDAFASSAAFTEYLAMLAKTDPSSLPRIEQLAFWINAYNAYTILQINAHAERSSIKNINKTGGFLSLGGAWKEKMATIGGHRYTLDEIEHDQIRPVFQDPRVHFALVCAALGCPPLRSQAYQADSLDGQLDGQARAFLLHSPTKNRVDVASRTIYLSPIFDWYGKDFGANRHAMLQWLARYFPAGAERNVLTSASSRVKWTDYDWSLNIR